MQLGLIDIWLAAFIKLSDFMFIHDVKIQGSA